MVEHPTPPVPLSDEDRTRLITSTVGSDKSTQYKLTVTRAALDATDFGDYMARATIALDAERALVLGRTADACHTITLAYWQGCDVCGAVGEGN